jgi:anti-sigma regulatory factor (Ser/Thr protein kinase)
VNTGAAAPVLPRVPVPRPPIAGGGPEVAHPWPLREFLELGALPGAVPCARLHTRQVLWEWALTPLTEAVEHVVCELVTNAVAATRAATPGSASADPATPPYGPVRLWLLSDSSTVLVLVWDAELRRPVLAEAGEEAENGRGLFLVQAFSERWGARPTPHLGGKVVWALCGAAAR